MSASFGLMAGLNPPYLRVGEKISWRGEQKLPYCAASMNVIRAFLIPACAALAATHALAADFPAIYNSEPDTNAAPPSPLQSLAMLKLPPGFKATVFAAEPDVQQPISMTWDARGRLWIAENYTYAATA